ncbi:MAG TPA: sigma-54 dependent transcriptional regulator, partial [Pyrinomonadaceae bacterium]|nr:sigma-54 dependent transcriptional regulator [Pyrinomonadaceae bacterium]
LAEEDYEIITAANGRFALAHIENEQERIDLIVTDVQMPELKGDELLRKARERRAETPVVVITAFGSVENAVEMVKAGAFSYLTKPFQTKDLLEIVSGALVQTEAARAQAHLRREIPAANQRIIGASRPMREMQDLISRAARSTSNILITGESGTGKELVARAVHDASARSEKEFVAVNCAAIPAELVESELFGHTGQAFTGARAARAGLFETADGGTLFLDEIGELPLNVQPKLLRVLQEGTIRRVGDSREKQIDVRVIAATNRDLERAVANGEFREDLYWRVNVIHLHVPPLRERAFDVPLLVEHFLAKIAKKQNQVLRSIAPDALALLTAYSWQGNVRELENTLERAIALARGAVLTIEDLPERIRDSAAQTSVILAAAKSKRLTLAELEREYILEILREAQGNKSRAAETLGLDRKTLYRKLDEYRAADSTLDV